MENNRIDKVMLKEYLREIELAVIGMSGIDEVNGYRKALEKAFSKFVGSKYALAVNSGTDALQLALLALGIGKGDSVVLPDLTYISTGLVVKFVGAEPIFVDVKKDDLTIDETLIEKKLRPNTKAIIAVHMFGHPCRMERLKSIAEKHKLFLIEDACQALGSVYHNRKVGTFSDFAAFSFSYYKPLSSLAGNGGMVVFQKEDYFKKIDPYLNFWKTDKRLSQLNHKFHRMSLVDLATVKVKLKFIQQIIRSRDLSRKTYEENLSSLQKIRFFKNGKGAFSVRENYHILASKRDRLLDFLKKRGIDAEYPYPPLHSLSLFKPGDNEFPVTNDYYKRGLHLPLYSFMKKEETLKVVESIKRFYQ